MLLSFILLSYIVVSNREIMNIKLFFTFSAMSNSLGPNAISKDVYIDVLRGRSNMSSLNFSKESLAYSSISLVSYEDYMRAQNNDLSWAD